MKETWPRVVAEVATDDEPAARSEVLTGPELETRIEAALARVDFQPTPEVREAVGGFYADHYRLAGFLTDLLAGDAEIEPPEADPATPHELRQTASQLAEAYQNLRDNPDGHATQVEFLRQAVDANQRLFAESSLGVTTVSEAELDLRHRIGDQILEFGQRHGLTPRIVDDRTRLTPDGTRFDPVVEIAQDQFWADVRRASRLEFHGSVGIGPVIASGGLMSRTEQVRQTGTYATENVRGNEWDGAHHSNVVKFSEFMPQGDYARVGKGMLEATPGTVGIPIADIIEVAPFARNAEFATVAVRPQSAGRLEQQTPTEQVVKSIGSGGADQVGFSSANSRQRAFFATPSLSAERPPDDYRLTVSGMGASGRDPASATRALFTYQPHRDAEADAYHWMPPAGYQFPVHYELKIPQDQHDVDTNQDIVDRVQTYISDNPKYRDKYVIPLRRGVSIFYLKRVPALTIL